MLQENIQENQVQTTSLKKLELGLYSLIRSNDLKPEQAFLMFKFYGEELSNGNEGLYNKLGQLALIHLITRSLLEKDIDITAIKVVLKNFDDDLKKYEPILYQELIAKVSKEDHK